jgi:hypothetical protein
LPQGYSLGTKEDQFFIEYGPNCSGALSSSGRQIIAPIYNQVEYLGEGMFRVTKWGEAGAVSRFLVDSRGTTVCKLPDWARFGPAKRFHDGLLNIGESYVNCTFIDKRGRVAFKCSYSDASDFSDGLSIVRYTDRNGKLMSGYINRRGDLVIGPFEETGLYPFTNGFATISQSVNGKTMMGIINKSGKFVLPPQFETISPSTKETFFATKDEHFLLLNAKAQVLIRFPESVTTVQLPAKLIKQTLIPCGFGGKGDRANYIGKVGSKWGYCDSSGKIIITPKFSYCNDFVGDLAVACTISHDDEQLSGIIDKQGNWVIPPKYQWIQIVTPNRFIVSAPQEEPKEAWKNGRNRSAPFAELLKSYNFIGMRKSELQKIFGEPGTAETPDVNKNEWASSIRYDLAPGAFCGNASASVEFGINKEDQVFGWRATGGSRRYQNYERPWITENVAVEDQSKDLELGNLVPKEP